MTRKKISEAIFHGSDKKTASRLNLDLKPVYFTEQNHHPT